MQIKRKLALAMLMASASGAAVAQPAPGAAEAPLAPAVPSAPIAPPAPPPPPPPPPPPTIKIAQPIIEKGSFLSRAQWWRCDGFLAPGRSSDSMTHTAGLLASSEASRSKPRFGEGAAICDAALNDPRMVPQFNARRANILQARAMHKAERGDHGGALADLDESDRALGSETYGRRSIGANTQLIRGYLQWKAGNKEAALKTLADAQRLRPWEPLYRQLAARIHLAASRDWKAFIAASREIARIDPGRLASLYAIAMMRGEWEEMVALYPQLVFTVPRNRGGFEVRNLLASQVDQMNHEAEMHGAYAYALAALGRKEDAVREIAAARAALDAHLVPPKPIGDRTQITREQKTVHTAFVTGSVRGKRTLDRYALLVDLRGRVNSGEFQSAYVKLMEEKPGIDGATLDLVQALRKIGPGEQAELGELADMMQTYIATVLDRFIDVTMADIFEAMPEPEAAAALPAYDGGGDGFFALDRNGYRTHEGVVEGTQTIRFASTKGSVATANEMVLLRAAELARRGGHKGLILVARRGLIREIVTVGPYGGGGGSAPAGQEAEVDVVFVDPANLPPKYAGAQWRVLDPEQVWNELAPLYPSPKARRTASAN